MISEISEYREVRYHVEQEWARAKKYRAQLPTSLTYGVMLEVPSLVNQLDFLLKEVDFVAIGTNDLFQFFYACDRTNPSVSNRYDVLSSTFLAYLHNIRKKCRAFNIPVSVCGDMASKPIEALALLAMGYHLLSISGPSIGNLKRMILSLPLKEAESFMTDALKTYSPL